jgi:Ca-activated chloride channel family protein
MSAQHAANDIEPSRIEAAREAAKAFVKEQPPDVRIGIVTFAGSAQLVQRPTRDRDDLVAAIDRLQLQLHTAIGSGIIVSLATLFPDQGLDLESADFHVSSSRETPRAKSIDRPETKQFEPVPPGSNRSAAIILLTDDGHPPGSARQRGWPPIWSRSTRWASARPARNRERRGCRSTCASTRKRESHRADDRRRVFSGEQRRRSQESVRAAQRALRWSATRPRRRSSAIGALLVIAAAALSLSWYSRIT